MSDASSAIPKKGLLGGLGLAGITPGSLLADIAKRGDLALAFGVIAIIVVLILPLPAFLLDFSLAISITFSVLVLMTALFIQKPLEFSAFPTVLLIATMLRLALNLASTRLILGHGHEGTESAGKVIEAFGNFVMQGNFVIGVIVFAILVIVNFVVITKGSGRIAEVAARFTLDAMPGKQMAIDADLSAGLIDEKEARTRRSDLENESSFFGAMDGASKFVRGDAIAGLLITFINVVGGIVIGVAQNDMGFGDAAHTYTLLTVGDGLVSQIPALIVSTAAGLLVSKAGVEGAADEALFEQLSGYPQALGMSSFVMGTMALLPGLPAVPFLLLAGATGGLAFYLKKTRRDRADEIADAEAREADAVPVAEEPISTALKMDELRLEIGYALLPLINGKDHQKLTDQIKALRRQIASDMGFVMPSVRILDNVQIDANSYVIRVKEVESGRGDVYVGQLLVMDPHGGQIQLPGLHTTEPAFGLPATWIDEGLREEASFRGYTVVDPPTVLTTHLTEIIKDNMADLLSYAEVQKLLDELGKEHKKLVEDLVPSQITVTGIQRVLQTLLNERISIRDLATIMEGIAEAVGHTQSLTLITEHVRARLARQICAAHADAGNAVPLITLSPRWEQAFAESLIGQGEEKQLAMQPSVLQEFIASMRDRFEDAARAGEVPVLLTSPGVRPYVRSIVERFRPQTFVMSQNEVHPRVRLRTVGSI
ncbi:flagellar biosynthesis protein FlhA [Parvibaculum sp.]|uniref:flagellar biosynthesis protein FlhA n=1 Tax=Parvibaculum sp. TaxID=2024848 RepID=UPI00273204CB|nr:flagellar biosynthesis protein FlhA [Parvibaculum sp.]MDP1628805.1 flagellar biosynthesis protein FlhA [Parvibaculum sp.]MDP2148200.1 flagellar biosynthesis protein FlhA [Parvibaculum sp.]MDP3329050.1 flagellar biosynthesis protein FlhA [Parvibaculum sp.]